MATEALAAPTDHRALLDQLPPIRRRLVAWFRYRNYPVMRRMRRDAVLDWTAALVRHSH